MLLYWLANQGDSAIAIDLYEGGWPKVNVRKGDPTVLDDMVK
jgi:hypothetical protein